MSGIPEKEPRAESRIPQHEQLGLLEPLAAEPDSSPQKAKAKAKPDAQTTSSSARVVEREVANKAGKTKKPRRTLAPMLQQYVDMKQSYPEHLLLFQVGDFYEVFFEDAVTAAEVLGIRLTSRDKDPLDPIPMCGVPIHALDNYLPKLLKESFSCVVMSQVEDAKASKGMVKRAITRIVTPGVRYEGDGLDEKEFNYLAAACVAPSGIGAFAYIDVSTGHLRVRETETLDELLEVSRRVHPAEILLPATLFSAPVEKSSAWLREMRALAADVQAKVVLRSFENIGNSAFLEHLQERTPTLGSESPTDGLSEAGRASAEVVLRYVEEVSFGGTPTLAQFSVEEQARSVFIDAATRRNLEITETRLDGDRRNSLVAHVDYCKTAMGSRLLCDRLLTPSSVPDEILDRLDAVEALMSNTEALEQLRHCFAAVRDIDRLVTRITGFRANPRDLAMLRESLETLPEVESLLSRFSGGLLENIKESFDALPDVYKRLRSSLVEEPPLRVSEGGIFSEGFHEEVDRLRSIRRDGKSILAKLEAKEKERSGISALRIKYNNVFGYFIEVSKAHLAKVPEDFERKQTLVNAERFVTRELKEHEVAILSAKGKQLDLEKELFSDLRHWLSEQSGRMQHASRLISELDVLCAFAELARKHKYTRPSFCDDGTLKISNGRHPVVERVLGAHNFIPNDVRLDRQERRLAVLTGPNMGGKSTYLRQIGLIQLLAQAGSFVPAEQAELPIVDRIFTRIGAADDLSRGDSTFMVEMREAAVIVRKASSKSLVLIDEIGRGTATSDGLAIATAMSEWLHDDIGCITVFATHFHQLTHLAEAKEGAFCLSLGVIESNREIEFTHRIEERPADRSYGVEVARLAGLPERLLQRAESVLAALEAGEERLGAETLVAATVASPSSKDDSATTLRRELIDRLRTVAPETMTPLEALNELALLKQMLEQF